MPGNKVAYLLFTEASDQARFAPCVEPNVDPIFDPLEFTDTLLAFFIASMESMAFVPAVLLETKLEKADKYSRPSVVSSNPLFFNGSTGKFPIKFLFAASATSICSTE